MFPFESKILVVDDMKNMRLMVKSHLRALGFTGEIVEAEDGNLAYLAAEDALSKNAPFVLVISDWNMPNHPGITFLKKLRAHPQLKTLPFLMVTAEGQPQQILEAAEAGVSQYIMKPFTSVTLKEKLALTWKKCAPK